jgi:hypothetical protein
VVALAFGALVDDLDIVRYWIWVRGERVSWYLGILVLTIALTVLPLGPVTETQRPQLAASSQRARERAVPKRVLGRL